jgi:tRNA threonylcarbamoyladenosine biosynthesis protein TsaB
VYAGFYRRARDGVAAVAPEAALAPERLLERLSGEPGAVAFGLGRAAYPALSATATVDGPVTPSAAAVARLARPALSGAAFEAERVFALEPHYVRASEAEVKFPHGFPPRP